MGICFRGHPQNSYAPVPYGAADEVPQADGWEPLFKNLLTEQPIADSKMRPAPLPARPESTPGKHIFELFGKEPQRMRPMKRRFD